MNSPNGLMNETNDFIPDLTEVLDGIDFDKKPISHGKSTRGSTFGVHRWGALAIEMMAYPEEKETILENFGLTEYQYLKLKENELYRQVENDTRSSIMALAANGGFQLQARRLAEHGLEVLEDIMVNGADDKDRIAAAKAVAVYANLDPTVAAKRKENVQVNTGVQLVVNFSDEMRLPAAFAGGGNVVIDAVAENVE